MHILKMSVFALSLTAVVGCKAINAMDNTETMKTDLAAMKATTGGMAGTTESMEKTTLELKRKASIGEGLKLLDAPENQKEFAPPSKGLLAGAKLVAENMNSEELVKFFQAGLKEIRKTGPNEAEKDYRSINHYSAKYVAAFNRHKEVQVVTMQAIAAQIPQPMIEKIVQEQLYGAGGAQSDEVRDMLMLRAMFINEFFLNESVFATGRKLDNMGKLRNAMQYARQLQFIVDIARNLGQEKEDKEQIEREIDEACTKENANGEMENKCTAEEREAMLKEEVSKQPIRFMVNDIFLRPVIASEAHATNSIECNANPAGIHCEPTFGARRTYNEIVGLKIAKHWFTRIPKRIDKEMPEDMRGGASPYANEIAQIKEECLRHTAEQN